jgi:DNA-binding beta-propeller fold protein YncE
MKLNLFPQWPLVLTLLIIAFEANGQLKLIFQTDAVFRHPESAVYDPLTDCFYVSNMNKDTPEDSLFTDFISKISPTGEVLELHWLTGLSSPTGMIWQDGSLMVVERNGIAHIDVAARKIVQRIPISAKGFLNDIAKGDDETYYVSETSDAGRIYQIKNNEVSVFLEDSLFSKPNGLLVSNRRLLIGVNGDHTLKFIDLQTRQILHSIYLGPGNIDGIQELGDDFLVSHFMGALYKIDTAGVVETLLNTRDEDVFIADFCYQPNQKLIVIPSLRTNVVYGFEYPN